MVGNRTLGGRCCMQQSLVQIVVIRGFWGERSIDYSDECK